MMALVTILMMVMVMVMALPLNLMTMNLPCIAVHKLVLVGFGCKKVLSADVGFDLKMG